MFFVFWARFSLSQRWRRNAQRRKENGALPTARRAALAQPGASPFGVARRRPTVVPSSSLKPRVRDEVAAVRFRGLRKLARGGGFITRSLASPAPPASTRRCGLSIPAQRQLSVSRAGTSFPPHRGGLQIASVAFASDRGPASALGHRSMSRVALCATDLLFSVTRNIAGVLLAAAANAHRASISVQQRLGAGWAGLTLRLLVWGRWLTCAREGPHTLAAAHITSPRHAMCGWICAFQDIGHGCCLLPSLPFRMRLRRGFRLCVFFPSTSVCGTGFCICCLASIVARV